MICQSDNVAIAIALGHELMEVMHVLGHAPEPDGELAYDRGRPDGLGGGDRYVVVDRILAEVRAHLGEVVSV